MPRKVSTLAPQIDPIRLGDLDDGIPEQIDARQIYELKRFAGGVLDGHDLGGISFLECELIDLSMHETQLRAARFVETRIERLTAPTFTAPRSGFRDVTIDGSRLGSAEFYDADWRSVQIRDSKLGFVNLRGATLQDVLFTNCTIDELDLGGASATRLSFVDSTVNTLELGGSRMSHVDLRGLDIRAITGIDGLAGVTMTSDQVTDLAALLAQQFGIKVEG